MWPFAGQASRRAFEVLARGGLAGPFKLSGWQVAFRRSGLTRLDEEGSLGHKLKWSGLIATLAVRLIGLQLAMASTQEGPLNGLQVPA